MSSCFAGKIHSTITGLLSLIFLILGCWQGYQMAGVLGAIAGAPVGALLGLILGLLGWHSVFGLLALFS